MNSWKVSSAELKWSVNAPSSTSWTARRSASSGIPPEPAALALDQPEHHALALPPGGVGTSSASPAPPSGSSATTCGPARSRHRRARRAGARPRRTTPVSICCTARPRAAPTALACASAHSKSTSLHRSAWCSSSSRSTTWTKSIRPSARSWTLPHARISPSGSRTTRFSRVTRAVRRRPRRGRPPLRAGPAPTGTLVAAQQLGRAGRRWPRRCRPAPRPPARRPGSSGSASSGSLSNLLSSGITRESLFRTRCSPPRGGGLDLRPESAQAVRWPRRWALAWRDSTSARSTSISASSSATMTIASAARESASSRLRSAAARPASAASARRAPGHA